MSIYMAMNIARIRVLTYINLLLVFAYFAGVTFLVVQFVRMHGGYLFSDPFTWNYLVIACLAGHTALVLYIHRNRYPNKEINRVLKSCTIVFGVLCGIIVLIMVIGVAGLLWVLITDKEAQGDWLIIAIELSVLLLAIVTFSYQISAGNRLMVHIQNNYRHELENSIA